MTLTVRGNTTIKGQTTVGFSPASLFAQGEQGVWYEPSDLSTLYQDVSGTTLVTAVEQPVGLMLDKRQPNGSVYFDGTGDYLTNTTPSASLVDWYSTNYTIEYWIYANAFTGGGNLAGGLPDPVIAGNMSPTTTANYWSFGPVTGGVVRFYYYNGAATAFNSTASALSTGVWYHLAFVNNAGSLTIYVNGVASGTASIVGTPQSGNTFPFTIASAGNNQFNGYISNLRVVKGVALYTANFTPSRAPLTPVSGTSLLTCGVGWSGNPAITRVGDAMFSALNPFGSTTGNHASQSTAAARPVLSARVNLLTKTEDLTNAVWSLGRSAGSTLPVVTSGATDPNGGTTAFTVAFGAISGASEYSQIFQTVSLSAYSYLSSIYIRANAAGDVGKKIYLFLQDSGGLKNTLAITLTANYARVETSGAVLAGSDTFVLSALGSTYGGGNQAAVTADIWHPDLRPTNSGVGLPAYQRVNTSTDYDTTGFPFYLRFDGVDDSMSTGSVSLGGNKAQVFSGVRKLTDAAPQIIAELSADFNTNVGSFYLACAPDATTNRYGAQSRGTNTSPFASQSNVTGVGAAPDTAAISALFDIGGPSCIIRRNGVAYAAGTNSQGSGNFGNYPIYIGSRAGTSLYLNGNLYSMLIRGAASTTQQTAATESYVNKLTKAY